MLLQRGFGFNLEAGALDVAFKSFEVDGIASEDLLSILNHRVRAAVLRRFKSFTWVTVPGPFRQLRHEITLNPKP